MSLKNRLDGRGVFTSRSQAYRQLLDVLMKTGIDQQLLYSTAEDVLNAFYTDQPIEVPVDKEIISVHCEQLRQEYQQYLDGQRQQSEDVVYVVDSASSSDGSDFSTDSEVDQLIKDALGDFDQEQDEEEVIATSQQPLTVDEATSFWLLQLLSDYYTDPVEVTQKYDEVMKALESSQLDQLDLKQELLVKLKKYAQVIYWGAKLSKASDAMDKLMIEQEIHKRQLPRLKSTVQKVSELAPTHLIDLNAMAFADGSHTMTNKKCALPEGSYKNTTAQYEEIIVPASKVEVVKDEPLVSILDLPEWTHKAFAGMKYLNRIQSKVCNVAFNTDENLLVCAPTSAGKTNIALLTILHQMSVYHQDYGKMKIVYVAPMKALVQEMVASFRYRLESYGIHVSELTGDSQLTRKQIAETHIIVTTPEKYDIVTRKGNDSAYVQLVKLVIIDEIHLLHDERGPVIESIVARTIRQSEVTREHVRLVGLSATLPNYADVAAFLRVDPKLGMFHFDNSYRPCPLLQGFIGVTEQKLSKRNQVMNQVVYTKCLEQAGQNQVIVFVHARKDTYKTAQYIKEQLVEGKSQFLPEKSLSKDILKSQVQNCDDPQLKQLLPFGVASHHAGMTRKDRSLVEDLFADKHIQIIIATSTLAAGVNLPAHTVIIKGTQIYSPQKGRYIEMSPQDVLQMLGRAGRPQYDTFGEGFIITEHSELQFYLSLMNAQLPIESQMVTRLADVLNAEIVLGTVTTRDEAVEWLGSTYLFNRMLRQPSLYGISDVERMEDTYLDQKRIDLAHTALVQLQKSHLLQYEVNSGRLVSTELGRISSYYYISHKSMTTYNQQLRPTMKLLDIFQTFSISEEFKYIPVRLEEKHEVEKLLERVPVPVKESADDPIAKINVLLQAYVSRLSLEGQALLADMVYVTQSAGRIMRALFEISICRGWAEISLMLLDLCKMIDKRLWKSNTPLRQLPNVNVELMRRLERKEVGWDRLLELEPEELGQLVRTPKASNLLHKLVHVIPKLELQVVVKPLTPSLLQIEVEIQPDFVYDMKYHNRAGETFWIMAIDGDGERLLHHEQFVLKPAGMEQVHEVEFTVPVFEPMSPNYFLVAVSDRWLHAETRVSLSFRRLVLPKKFSPVTELTDQVVPVTALKAQIYVDFVKSCGIVNFNCVQSHVFDTVYGSDQNVLVAAPESSGLSMLAQLSFMRYWAIQKRPKSVIYVTPVKYKLHHLQRLWFAQFKALNKSVGTSKDNDLVMILPSDTIDYATELVVFDDLHLMNDEYEAFIMQFRNSNVRVVALSQTLANYSDVASWLKVDKSSSFCFDLSARPVPLELHIKTHNVSSLDSVVNFIVKTVADLVDGPTIVFVPSASQVLQVAESLVLLSDGKYRNDIGSGSVLMQNGVAQIQDIELFIQRQVQVMVVERSSLHLLEDAVAQTVIVLNTQYVDGQVKDYTSSEIHSMCGYASMQNGEGYSKAYVFMPAHKKQHYKKVLQEGCVLESKIDLYFSKYLLQGLKKGSIVNKQGAVDYLTESFMYKRLVANPNYYDLPKASTEVVSEFLSEIVEVALTEDLQEIVEVGADDFELSVK